MVLTALTIILVTTGGAFPARAATVIGTGDPTMDIANVQKAVDKGGNILLKGTFDFGREGSVTIHKSAKIVGETGSDGRPDTEISGGRWTFHTALPVPGAPPAKTGPNVTISNIRFLQPRGTPMHFEYLGALTVTHVEVERIRPERITLPGYEDGVGRFAAGLVVGTRLASRRAPIKDAVSGTIRIRDNRFYMDVDHPSHTAGRGIMCVWTHAARITIADNVIRGASRNGIEAFDNFTGLGGRLEISGNNIITAKEGIDYPNPLTPNGIAAGWFLDTKRGASAEAGAPPVITRNRVEVRGERSIGIAVFANNAVGACNDIILAGGEDSMGIVQTGSYGFFMNNRIRGLGRYAVYAAPFESYRASGNTFAWTDIAGLDPERGSYYLAGNGNSVLGKAGSVVDQGLGNRLLDIRPCSLPGIDPNEDWEPLVDRP